MLFHLHIPVKSFRKLYFFQLFIAIHFEVQWTAWNGKRVSGELPELKKKTVRLLKTEK